SEDGGSATITIEADDHDEAETLARRETRDWIREGDWGIEGARVRAYYSVVDSDGDTVVDNESTEVEIEPDHEELMRRAGADPDCEHEWTSEGEGGCDSNPGVWSTGGTSMTFASHCRLCGLHKTEHTTG